MKHQFNKSISLLLAVLLCVSLFAFPVSAAEGTCGDDLTWTLENGVLTISGKGEMYDYGEFNMAPWMENADLIQRVVVEKGVTSVGQMAFYHCANLTIVTLADSVKALDMLAFAGCTSLKRIDLGGTETIGRGCFYDCFALSNVIMPESLKIIGDEAFFRCNSLGGITIPASVTQIGASAFAYCESLAYVRIEGNITVVPQWAFYGCEQLSIMYLPSSVESVEKNALGECPELHYVDYGGSTETKQEIQEQLSQDTSGASSDKDVSYSESDGAVITTTTNNQMGNNIEDSNFGTTIDATVTDSTGWEDVVDSITGTMNSGTTPEVEVQVQGDSTMPEGALTDLIDRDVTVTIHTSDNADWQVIMGDQTADTLKGSQDFSLEFSKNESDKYTDVIGEADSYIVTLGETTLNSTLLLPLGSETARRVATLYLVDGGELVKLSSVIIDDDGKAAFCLAGTSEGEYVIALDVQDIPREEVLIPEKLAEEYDITYGATLTDSQGNQYVLTGRVNKLGISLGTLTWIIVGVLVGSVVLVGIVMVIWNKQQKKQYAMRRRKPPVSGA